MKRLFFIFTSLLILSATALAARNVTGVVVNAEDGEPLVGASILATGTSIGSATDIEGRFTLQVPDKVKKLKVSYVGMETREVDITPGTMRIELQPANQLDEVIAVAFGTAKKSAFTGSASVMSSEELSKHIPPMWPMLS